MKKKWKKSYLTEGSIHKETCPLFALSTNTTWWRLVSLDSLLIRYRNWVSKKVFVSRPKSNWLPFLRRRPHSSISNLGDILFIVNKSVKSLMCDIEVKSKKCKELTLYRCYYCIVVPIPIALRGHRGLSQSTAALRANPRSLYLCFFPATIDLLMASNFSQPAQEEARFF